VPYAASLLLVDFRGLNPRGRVNSLREAAWGACRPTWRHR